MAIAVDTTGDGSLNGTGTSVVVTPLATVSEGAVIYVYLHWESGNGTSVVPDSYTPASGFSEIAQVTNASDFAETTVFRKVAGASEPSTYTFQWAEATASDTYGAEAGLLALSGVANGTPNGTPVTLRDAVVDNTYNIPALTTTAPNSWDVAFVANSGGVASVSVNTWGDSLIERVDTTNGDYSHAAIATALRATAGVQAATECTSTGSDESHAIRLEVFGTEITSVSTDDVIGTSETDWVIAGSGFGAD